MLASFLWVTLLVLPVFTEVVTVSRLPPDDAERKCSRFVALYSNIDADLSRWKKAGISLKLMQRTISMHTPAGTKGQKGFAAGFWKGKAYLLGRPDMMKVGHHAALHVVYMRMLQHLERSFTMPDVDLVISTIDRPLGLQLPPSGDDEPVMRFCKGDSHADILIPIFHFHMKHYEANFLAKAAEFNSSYPWERKKDILFGRYTAYARHYHPADPNVPPRLGAGGISICNSSRNTKNCLVRDHFAKWSQEYPNDLDISSHRGVPMIDHAMYKYLVHLDGQGLSSKLDQLLPLNSLVFKEESGYRGFYHHLLKPYEHYVPFWKERPEEVLEVIKWARGNDAEAKRIAANGQKLALEYLNSEARSCYWYRLLTELSKLLQYKPGQEVGRKYMEDYIPLDSFLESEAAKYERGTFTP